MDSLEVQRLAAAFDDETDGLARKSQDLTLALLRHTGEPFSRHQFTPGHITCTGLVLARSGGSILLVHHRRLDRWLLPGGHVESDDASPSETARREVVEETAAVLDPGFAPVLAGIDVHGIPPKRGEPFHLHHDLIFAFRAASDTISGSAECRAARWVQPAEFAAYAVPENVPRALGRMRRMACWS